MDRHLHHEPLINYSNKFQLENQSMADFSNQNLRNEPSSDDPMSNSFADVEDNKNIDDCESTHRILKHIDQLLMEEGMDEQTRVLQESLDFQAKERSFYEVLGQNYPHSPSHVSDRPGQHNEITNDNNVITGNNINRDDCDFSGGVLRHIDQMLMEEGIDEQTHMLQESLSFQAKERSFYEVLVGPKHPHSPDDDVVHPSSRNTHTIHNDVNFTNNNMISESEVVLNFQKGVDDANQLLLIGSSIDVGKIKGSHLEEARGKKKKASDFGGEEEEEERSKKLPAVCPESNNVPIQEFDDALIYVVGRLEKKLQACAFQEKGSSNKAKGRRRPKNLKKKEVIDFRSLLICCAQSVAADDLCAADVFLKQIREHSSPVGDGEQRLAHYFANGLEARLAGTGSQLRQSHLVKRTTASDYLRAFYTYISACPFVRISNCVSNKMILDKSRKENSTRIHIIDFGILHGFQWPTYFKHLSEHEGGPPKLKMTGIDFPQTGFWPSERVEETGRRLARYAKMFNLPFEFIAIAQNWESIKIEDLKLEKGEFVTVNCLYQAENLLEEAGVGECPRTMVLDLIRKIKPDYFIHGVVSAGYAMPFFVSRFREALFHYSAIYDMLETTIPRENPQRTILERDIFGKEALNVIACEEGERLGRTETYKQWRLRHLRAGFVQIPFERNVMDTAINMVTNLYHREFLIHGNDNWLLMGWKGRILYAMSCWQPVSENASFFDRVD